MASQRIYSLLSTGGPSHPASSSSPRRPYLAESAEGRNVHLPLSASTSSLPAHFSPSTNLLPSTSTPSIRASFPRAPSACAPSLPSALSSPPSLEPLELHPFEPALYANPQRSTARALAAVLPLPNSTSIRHDSPSSRTPRSYPASTSAVDDFPDVVTSPNDWGPFLPSPSSDARHDQHARSNPSVLLPPSFKFMSDELQALSSTQPHCDRLSNLAWDVRGPNLDSIPLMPRIVYWYKKQVVDPLQAIEPGDPASFVLIKYAILFRVIAATVDSINKGLADLWAPFSVERSEVVRATFVKDVARGIRYLVAVLNSVPTDLDDVSASAKVFAGILRVVGLTEAICFVIASVLQVPTVQSIVGEERASVGSLVLALLAICKVVYQIMGNVPKASPEVYRSARAGISGMREYGIELLYWQIELLAGMQTAMQLHEGAPLPRDDFQVAYDHHHRHPSSGRFTAVARTGADVIRKSHRLNLCPLSIEGYQALAVEPNFFTPDESVYHRSSWMQVVLKRLERLDIRQTRSPP